MNRLSEIFYSKIILFGEYAVIFDSMGLTIPFTHFMGELSFSNQSDKFKYTDTHFAYQSNHELLKFVNHLKKVESTGHGHYHINISTLEKDIEKGLYFESSIPQGYGLGSSGALCAAIYSRYTENPVPNDRKLSPDEIRSLKDKLAHLESYFHGKSSGIDPLNSYIKFPLLIRGKSDIQTVEIPGLKSGKDNAIFLINTGRPRHTEPLVNRFIEKTKEKHYFDFILNRYIPVNNACIIDLLNGNRTSFFENVKNLSAMQIEHFREMIPGTYLESWQKGLESGEYFLKLCGSGGGGYLLGFTENMKKTEKMLQHEKLEYIVVQNLSA